MSLLSKNSCLKHKGSIDLKTERFLLRKFKKDDVFDVFSNWASCDEASAYNAWETHGTVEETKMYLGEWVNNYKKLNYYHWAITNEESGEVIGSISVSNIKNRKKYCEIGYTVSSKYWNKGIATEVLTRVLNYLVTEIGFETIHAMYDFRNKASGRVMEKAGMIFLKKKKKFFVNRENLIMNCLIYEYKA